jgi:SAM-dependent methyltransferase
LIKKMLRTAWRPIVARRIRAHARRQRGLVVQELSVPGAVARFAHEQALPPGYGAGATERVIEIPWLLSQRPSGRALDAGSSLNHSEFLDRLLPLVDRLDIVTLGYEGVAYLERDISYMFADLRDLPYRDEHFDTVMSISTLEHIGMDNTAYAGAASGSAPASDPESETCDAVRELMRVTRRGGRVLFTVPYGQRDDLGWQRQLDHADIERLLGAAAPSTAVTTVYRSLAGGWALSSLEDAADARYRIALGAEAVACVAMTR